MPRATTAAWLVMPPRVVRMPTAACMPWMSSGAGFDAHQDDLVALGSAVLGFIGREDDLAGGRTGLGRQAVADDVLACALGSSVGCSS